MARNSTVQKAQGDVQFVTAKHDPQLEDIIIPAFGVFRNIQYGDEAGKIEKAEVYLDISPLLTALTRAQANIS